MLRVVLPVLLLVAAASAACTRNRDCDRPREKCRNGECVVRRRFFLQHAHIPNARIGPNPPPPPPPPPVCFPETSQVTLCDGSTKPVKDLRVGEEVVCYSNWDSHKFNYGYIPKGCCKAVMWTHVEKHTVTDYFVVTYKTAKGDKFTVKLSGNHLILRLKDATHYSHKRSHILDFSKLYSVPADELQERDYLIAYKKGKLHQGRIVSIQVEKLRGVYSVLIDESAAFVVDDTIVSPRVGSSETLWNHWARIVTTSFIWLSKIENPWTGTGIEYFKEDYQAGRDPLPDYGYHVLHPFAAEQREAEDEIAEQYGFERSRYMFDDPIFLQIVWEGVKDLHAKDHVSLEKYIEVLEHAARTAFD